MKRISVAMVTYQGADYINEQMDSILSQLGAEDEIVISDDGSADGTKEILAWYQEKDERIRLLDGPRCGVKANVENALRACTGAYIFLADQDDIWMPDKVSCVMAELIKPEVGLVVHDAVVMDGALETVVLDSFYRLKGSGAGVLKNIWRNTYMGCCMAFKRELLEEVLPIPSYIEMHDQWIGVINDKQRRGTCFLPDKLLKYRRHGKNASNLSHYGILRMIKNRLCFVWALYTKS